MLFGVRKFEMDGALVQLPEKLRLLRTLEGSLRGLNRALTQAEVVRLIQEEQGAAISQAYLSQLESGKRPHMTEKTRELLARFFKVHPGYLVNDPEGYTADVVSVRPAETRLDEWLIGGSESLRGEDPEVAEALGELARHHATRELILLLAQLATSPDLVARLRESVAPAPVDSPATRVAEDCEEGAL